ncbi:hypothetical protein F5Y17DRAFT_226853 [Xylariaceae sp. FL0594]|nr:hypothetical protein F5Y17DRAFT_226853 [Xylariaceae sp. FL0594]
MEQLRLKPRQPVEEVEKWDDDEDFLIGDDEDLSFKNQSAATASLPISTTSRRRNSRSSFRSDRESLPGEEHQVQLPGDDEKSTMDAIAAAVNAGIPIPSNVPPSALTGGTIKRLDGRKVKKMMTESEDWWAGDLALPPPGQALRLKAQDANEFPETLRQVSNSSTVSPAKKATSPILQFSPTRGQKIKALGAPINLEKYRDNDLEDDDIFGDVTATIKPSRLATRGRPISLITPPTPSPAKKETKAVEDDLEGLVLPANGELKLSNKRDIPRTPILHTHDDFDWGEGSLGTRYGGTRRDAFSARSSSVSAMSPSIASSFTAESEDDFEGLILPMGPLDFSERLKRRNQSRSPERPEQPKKHVPDELRSSPISRKQQPSPKPASKPASPKVTSPKVTSPKIVSPRAVAPKAASPKAATSKTSFPKTRLPNNATAVGNEDEDMVSGLDFGEGNVFRFAKPTVHRNVKVKQARPISPTRPKTAVSITFTTRLSNAVTSRSARPLGGHERSHTQSSLEPVSESGDPIPQKPSRRPQSRLSGHSAHSSISSTHTLNTPSALHSGFPATPRRRELGQKASTGALRGEPTTTSAQLLRLKRSLPAMSKTQSPAKLPGSRSDRPPSRGESRADYIRPQSSFRPKTPVERARPGFENNGPQARKGQVPFLPAGASQSQSHNVNARSSRAFRRHDSDQGADVRPLSRAISRGGIRSPSPRRPKNEKTTPEPVWQQLNKPRRLRNFGDGHELDAFDDLPTSAQAESRYTKPPTSSGNKPTIRNRIYQNVVPDRSTPSPVSPFSSARVDTLPRFARDTAASRNAREASLAQRAQTPGFTPLIPHRVAHLSARTNVNGHVPPSHGRLRKAKKPTQSKPHLISNLNSAKDSKTVNGMTYNPTTFRWEGNENALSAFDVPGSSPPPASLSRHMIRDKETTTPRPLLITNINTKKETRRMGDMVFDPQNMCWLKVESSPPNANDPDDPMAGFAAMEEEDPFRDIPDLEDKVSSTSGHGRASDIREDWLVGEEFDVGPEFIRRQREEEARWQRKCEKWTGRVARDRTDWRWAIRDLVMQGLN